MFHGLQDQTQDQIQEQITKMKILDCSWIKEKI